MVKRINILQIIEYLYTPIIIISISISIVTFLVYFGVFASEHTFYSILRHFDLNEANTIADWFSVLIWIVFGLSFYMLGEKNFTAKIIRKKDRLILTTWGIILCVVSFEKIFHFHLMFEFRSINFLGLFSPALRKDSPYYWFYILVVPVFLLFYT